jgi:pimeloyl-ACP methyl ester carboxylesterase
MVMLERGWHIAYYDVSHMYGCPESIRLMHGFQTFVEKEFKLASRAILFGFSIGGIYSFNYAAEYPEKVAALYLDAPALDTAAVYRQHGEILYNRYSQLGGEIKLIMKPGAGHHPHSLENPLPIVEYLLEKRLR